jgi:hypothetical protein
VEPPVDQALTWEEMLKAWLVELINCSLQHLKQQTVRAVVFGLKPDRMFKVGNHDSLFSAGGTFLIPFARVGISFVACSTLLTHMRNLISSLGSQFW